MDADTQYWKSVAEAERKKNKDLLKRCGELAQDKDDLCKMLAEREAEVARLQRLVDGAKQTIDEREAAIARLVKEIEGKNG